MFRFTIRDLLWLTVLVAFAAAWWVDHRRAESTLDEVLRQQAADKAAALAAQERAWQSQLLKAMTGQHYLDVRPRRPALPSQEQDDAGP